MAEVLVKSLYKAMQLLSYFDAKHPEWGISELSKKSNTLKSTVYNVLSTLEVCDILQKSPENGKYSLGIKTLEMGNIYLSTNNSYEVIRGYMEQVSNNIGESVHLARLSDFEVVYIATAAPRAYSTRSIAGYRTDIHSTAIGKVLLSHSSPEYMEAYFEKVYRNGVEAHTTHTITDEAKFREELRWVREHGYAMDNVEHEYGIRCMSVPLRNSKGQIHLAMSISAPSPRLEDDKIPTYLELLQRSADEICLRI